MALDLETLKSEIQDYLGKLGVVVFYGSPRDLHTNPPVYWDTEGHPDFREFLDAGHRADAKIFTFYHQALTQDQIDEALDELDECNFPAAERNRYENRLRELQAYEGFTCALRLAFFLEGRSYVFERQTDWYIALTDILSELDMAIEDQENEDEGPMAGYFSRN